MTRVHGGGDAATDRRAGGSRTRRRRGRVPPRAHRGLARSAAPRRALAGQRPRSGTCRPRVPGGSTLCRGLSQRRGVDDARRGRSFLLQASVLGRFTAKMCDEVLERSDSGSSIEELERLNLFTTRLEQGGWFRIHSLFAEFARLHLTALDPVAATDIHPGAPPAGFSVQTSSGRCTSACRRSEGRGARRRDLDRVRRGADQERQLADARALGEDAARRADGRAARPCRGRGDGGDAHRRARARTAAFSRSRRAEPSREPGPPRRADRVDRQDGARPRHGNRGRTGDRRSGRGLLARGAGRRRSRGLADRIRPGALPRGRDRRGRKTCDGGARAS